MPGLEPPRNRGSGGEIGGGAREKIAASRPIPPPAHRAGLTGARQGETVRE
jgi:hypothetical protein